MQLALERASAPSPVLPQLQQARANYFKQLLPLQALAQIGAEGDQEAAEVLARACRGQTRSQYVDLTARLEAAYAELQQDLEDLAFAGETASVSLVDYIDALFASLDSLNSTLISQRAALLDLLTSPALARPLIPSIPDLASTAAAMRHSTATLATAQAKLALLLGTARASHTLHGVGPTAALALGLYEPELAALRAEVREIQEELGRYEALMAPSAEGDGKRMGGYRKLLRRWRELESEEKDVRGDLRRLGWVEGS